jgi:hypothetical protein
MTERPYSRYTRARTWAALYSQHLNAGYAWVPFSRTNNSIAVISCATPEEVQKLVRELQAHADECRAFYESRQTPDKAPTFLAKAREGVVLARSSDYYHYHLENYVGIKLVICGLHDSYLHIPTWEMRTNHRYKARQTAVAITDPDFDRIRCTQFGHRILVAAYAKGDPDATALIEGKDFPERTRSRLRREKDDLQDQHYRGRPLAFLTEAERRAIGSKISQGLRHYHQQKRLKAM